MNEMVSLLTKHGYGLLFLCVLGRQACLPVPANLVLIAAGALAGWHKLSVQEILAVTLPAFLAADLIWYEIGRKYGTNVLRFLRKTTKKGTSAFGEPPGATLLIFSKFLVGLDALAAPAAGSHGIDRSLFLLCDALGALIWTSVYLALGYVFRDQLNGLLVRLERIGAAVVWVGAALVIFFLFRRLLLHYRTLRAADLACR